MTPRVPIRDLATQIRGVTYRAAEASTIAQSGMVGVVRAGNIVDGELTNGNLVYVSASRVADKQRLRQGDVLIATSSGSLGVVGKAARIRRDEEVAFGAFCKVLRPGPNVDAGYFAHFFGTKPYRRHVMRVAAGSNINNLKTDDIDEIEIRLPPLEEQRRIAAVLDAANVLRAKRQETLAKIESLPGSIFDNMFGPPTATARYLESRLGDVTTIVTGNTPSRKFQEYYGGEIEWVKPDNIYESGVITGTKESLSASGRSVGREAPAGTSLVVCIGSTTTIGRVGYLDRTAAFNQQLNAVTPSNLLLSSFLHYWLRTMRSSIRNLATYSTIGMVTKRKLANLNIVCPPIAEQEKFDVKVDAILRLREKHLSSLGGLNCLFEALQQRAFRGEL